MYYSRPIIISNKISPIYKGAVHKVRHAIFGQFFPPPPVTLCHTSRDPLRKYVTHLGPLPRFLVGLVGLQKTRTKAPCINSLSIVRGGFCPVFCQGVFYLEGFVWG